MCKHEKTSNYITHTSTPPQIIWVYCGRNTQYNQICKKKNTKMLNRKNNLNETHFETGAKIEILNIKIDFIIFQFYIFYYYFVTQIYF